ncbi:MAG: M20/M25/M40 family metallo-hydrolase [Hyphomicrobiales bacterium]
MSGIDRVVAHIDENFDTSIERLFELLRIESISTDPAHAGACRQAADWLAGELNGLGFRADARETIGHPMVVGHYDPPDGAGSAPHVLFYGHYDVQPVDPLDLWDTPPFEPRRATVNGSERILARGAADDKGQLMTFLEAARAWIDVAGSLPLKVTVLFEGEEESGSKSLGPFLEQHGEELKADVALVCDTGMWDEETPAITTRLRGMYMDEVIVTGPSMDLHSGLYGGIGHNPIHILSRILGALHDEEGRVTLPGFYDGVEPVPEHVRDQWEALPFDEAAHLGGIGQVSQAGEADRGALEKVWARPTCDVNGIIGGYTGEGTKTVIPSQASAKMSFRLVGRQDPAKIRTAFRDFVRARLPDGCTAEFIDHAGSPALEIPMNNPHLSRAAEALEAEFGRPAAMIGSGGSIPIVGNFKTDLGMDSLLVGFGLDDDRIHSPNEKYNVSSYHHGIRSWARILDALAS